MTLPSRKRKSGDIGLDLLIMYSASKKGELVSLATLLHQRSIRFQPFPLPADWSITDSEDLMHQWRAATHWLFLIDSAAFKNPAFLFGIGYALAIHERGFLLEPGLSVPGYWKTSLKVCSDFSSLIEVLDAEKQRWSLFLSRLEAKGKLLERGLEASNSAYWEAVEKGDHGSCELFLQAGFSPDLTNKKGVSVLGLAVRSSHLNVIRALLDGGADINLRSKDRDNSPIMDAAAEGQVEIVQEFIDRGADLAGESRNGQNALVLAIGKGAQDVAILLLDSGADPFVVDKLGMNACQYAQLLGRKDFLSRVSEKFPDRV